jgi:hypothetical protein
VKSWIKITGAVCALALMLAGCDEVKKAAGESEEGATASAEGAESEGSEADEQKPEGECTIESIPFEAGAAGSGLVAFPVASESKGKQQNISDGGVGVLSLDDAEWVYHNVTAEPLEQQIRLSSNGKYAGYLVVDRGGSFGGPVKDVYVEVVDLGSKKATKFPMPKGSSDPLVYGVKDTGEPVLRFTATGDDRKLEMRTGVFTAPGEFDAWHTEPGRFSPAHQGVLTRDGTAIIAMSKVGDGTMGLTRLEDGSKPEVIYEAPDDVSIVTSQEISASADGSRVVFPATFTEGNTRKSGTVALDLSKDEKHRDLNFINARLSPDGEHLIGSVNNDTALLRSLVLRDFAKPENAKTFDGFAKAHRWSPDSKRVVAFTNLDDAVLESLSVTSGESVPLSRCHHYAEYGVDWVQN